jgi:hypothetical protein
LIHGAGVLTEVLRWRKQRLIGGALLLAQISSYQSKDMNFARLEQVLPFFRKQK